MEKMNNYIVEKVYHLDRDSDECNISRYDIYRRINTFTDIFNKKSRTTVCYSGIDDLSVMYCENCNETHYDNMDIELELRRYVNCKNYRDLVPTGVICKKCGSSYKMSDIRVIHRRAGKDSSDSRLVYGKIYNDDDFVKFSFKTCNMRVEKAFFSVDNKYKIIFNTKTGQTYLFNAPENRKNKDRFIYTNLPIINITFNGAIFNKPFEQCLIDSDDSYEFKLNLYKEIFSNIYSKISKNLGYNPPTLEDYAKEFDITDEKEIYNLSTISLYNRYPNFNIFMFHKIGNNISIQGVEVLNNMKKIKNTSPDVLQELLNHYKIPNKERFLKFTRNDLKMDSFENSDSCIYAIVFFSQLFHENIENREDYIYSLTENLLNHKYCELFGNINEFNRLIKRNHKYESCLFHFLLLLSKKANAVQFYRILKGCLFNSFKLSALKWLAENYFMMRKVDKKFKIDFDLIIRELLALSSSSDLNREYFKGIVINFLEDLNQSLYKSSRKKFNFKIKSILEYYNEKEASDTIDTNIYILSLYKYAPTINPYTLSKMLGQKRLKPIATYKDFCSIPDSIKQLDNLSTNVISDLFNYYNIPNVASLRKEIINNPENFSKLVYYSRLFKDVNVLKKIVSNRKVYFNYDINEIEIIFFNKDNPTELGYSAESLILRTKFIEELIFNQGEVIASNKLIQAYENRNEEIISDIPDLLSIYKDLYGDDYKDYSHSILKIHDNLIRLTGGKYYTLKKSDLKPFKYTKEELNLKYEYNGYTFSLAKNGRELVNIGSDLNNCVGGYIKRVRDKHCLIVSVSHKDEYKICIEIVPNNYSDDNTPSYYLNQAKLHSNSPVYRNSSALETVLHWMDINNIKNKSFDIRTLNEDNYKSNIDYNEELYLEDIPF